MKVSFSGHRPSKLYGYSLNDKRYQYLAKKLSMLIRTAIEKYGVREFYTGGALGTDTVAFFTVNCVKKEYEKRNISIKNILAIPFEKQYIKWNGVDKERYNRMISLADDVIYVDTLKEYKIEKHTTVGTYNKDKLQKRNEYMIDNTDILITIWDGSKSGTKNCIDYAKNKNGFSKIVGINPKTLKYFSIM